MAQIALSQAGAALGSRLLPGGLSVLGRTITGATIGRTLGSLAGQAIDEAVFSEPLEGPRLASLHVMESREGAGIPNVYGRMRVGGQVIWAGRFREEKRTSGGKGGGPRMTEYSYTASFAVALCEGPGVRISRIWANGEDMDLAGLTWRSYPGSETQEPDPIIEATEGAGLAPAYRGIAYVVFEDLPLERFGNRLPQLSFEVVRTPAGDGEGLADHVTAVNIIPASGEFVYAGEPVFERTFPGRERALNVHTADGRADFDVSIDQLQEELPGVSAVSLTVGWFGDDLRAGTCRIRPGVETRERVTVPWNWTAGGAGRADAYLISDDGAGNANYGGTPADRSVVQAIQSLKSRGLAVTLTPFLMMDVPVGNGLPDPYGGTEQAPFPWRGRITASQDKAAITRTEIEAFLGAAQVSDFTISGEEVVYSGPADDWGYRRFILHNAYLAKAAGGVSAFLIGTEMPALSKLRDATGAFPYVDGLCQLADEVKALLGPECEVSYAADWTEYGAYVPGDGSGDVLFPLDALWGRASVDFVGIDWYPPAGDWREGEDHLDRLAGYVAPDAADYLQANFEGGADYDWYYGDAAAREAQIRTPIIDTAHSEDWVFRTKDLTGWWNGAHHERPGGVRNANATAWQPGSKPIRLSEIGFPAVDKAGNAPNLFYDPKSSESAFPPDSTGARDDVFQRRAIIQALAYWTAKPFVEAAVVWCWDARPFPVWPSRTDIWSDGDNWAYGHWLNGRTGLAPVTDVVRDIAGRAGIVLHTGPLDGVVEGYALDGVTTVRRALEPLTLAFGLDMLETGDDLRVEGGRLQGALTLDPDALTGERHTLVQEGLDHDFGRLTLTYADSANGFQPAQIDARRSGVDVRKSLAYQVPLVLSEPKAEALARRLLEEASAGASLRLAEPTLCTSLAPGVTFGLEGLAGLWRVTELETGPTAEVTLREVVSEPFAPRALDVPGPPKPARTGAAPDLLVIDAPRLPGEGNDPRPRLAVFADPWPGGVEVYAGADPAVFSVRAGVTEPALTGRLVTDLPTGPVGRWDRASHPVVEMAFAELESASSEAVRAGANTLFVETTAGWEVLSFRDAALIAPNTYELRGLLRGLHGSDAGAEAGAAAGARCVLVDDRLVRGSVNPAEMGAPMAWRAGLNGEVGVAVFDNIQARPWRVAHLRVQASAPEPVLRWAARAPVFEAGWLAGEPQPDARFEVEWDTGAGFAPGEIVVTSQVTIPEGAVEGRVRQLSASGHAGEWVTIRLDDA